MRTRRFSVPFLAVSAAVAGLLVLVLAGFSSAPQRSPDPGQAAAEGRSPVGGLSARQLAGQRTIASYSGTRPPKELFRMVRRGEVAGVIFFAANIAGRSQLRRLARRLQQARKQARPRILARSPLLLMADQEGGQVRRLSGAPRRSQLSIGRSQRAARLARRAGAGAAKNLRGAGLNVNLAPVLDVMRAPAAQNLMGSAGRTYGSSPRRVGRLGASFVRAQQRRGVAAAVKHFPGLGPARHDQHTDLRPVTLTTSKSTLRRVDRRPYGRAIAAGARLVMTSHARYRALDRRRPATFSPKAIEGILRGKLGYRGVVVTDALEAPSLAAFGGTAKRSLLAARAGADLMLYSGQDLGQGRAGHRALWRALRAKRLARRAFERSAARVLELRRELRGGQPLEP